MIALRPVDPLLSVEGISRSFSGIPVLREVTFAVGAGRVVGLVGENGAGKSTLMNILGGNLTPDSGRLQLAGICYAPRRPTDATRAGIAFVHQELNLSEQPVQVGSGDPCPRCAEPPGLLPAVEAATLDNIPLTRCGR